MLKSILMILQKTKDQVKESKKNNLISKSFLSIIILLYIFCVFSVVFAQNLLDYLKIKGNYYQEQHVTNCCGSMHPTFDKNSTTRIMMWKYPNGVDFLGQTLFKVDIDHGDIIAFNSDRLQNIKSSSENLFSTDHNVGFIKRVIGLPGDLIEVRDGLLYRNSIPLKEPYTYKPRSTFGGQFTKECQPITVEEDTLFVVGDNRKISYDSRHEMGLVHLSEVEGVLKIKDQVQFSNHYRNTDNDLSETSKIKLNQQQYISLLNVKRDQNNLQPFKFIDSLKHSAQIRSDQIFVSEDLESSSLNNKSHRNSMHEAGYSNIITAESVTQGYYEADELVNLQFMNPNIKELLLDANLNEIGIAEVEGSFNNCPTQLITIHMGGYIPPNYEIDTINSLSESLDTLKSNYQNLKKLRGLSETFYNKNKTEYDKLEVLLTKNINEISRIVNKLESNEWLSEQEQTYLNSLNRSVFKIIDKQINNLNESVGSFDG